MSTRRVFVGVASGIALAVPVGFVLGWYRSVRAFCCKTKKVASHDVNLRFVEQRGRFAGIGPTRLCSVEQKLQRASC